MVSARGTGELCEELAGPVRVHARSLDEDEVRRAKEIDTGAEQDELDEVAKRQAGGRDEAASEAGGGGDDEHVHEVEGVAHASSESDPRSAEYLASDGAVEGREVGEKDEGWQNVVEIVGWDDKDRDPYDRTDKIPPAAGSRFSARGAEIGQEESDKKVLKLAGQVPGCQALEIDADQGAGKDHRDDDAATKSGGTDGVEEPEQRREDVELYLDLQTPGNEVEGLSRHKVSQIDDVRQERRDQRPQAMLGDCDRKSVDEQGEDVGRLQPSEPAAEECLNRDGLAVEKTLTQEWLSQDETADGEEEQNATVAVIDEDGDAVFILRREYLPAAEESLSENVNEQGGGDGYKTQAVDLGNPVSVCRDAAKFHSIPGEDRLLCLERGAWLWTACAAPTQNSNTSPDSCREGIRSGLADAKQIDTLMERLAPWGWWSCCGL